MINNGKYKGIEGLEQKLDFRDLRDDNKADYTKVDGTNNRSPRYFVITTTSDVSFKKVRKLLLDQGYVKAN